MNRARPSGRVAVAALSARALAQAAVRGGYEVVALDCYGDADTRAAATRWVRLGDAAPPAIDPARTLAALHDLAQRGEVSGWVAGSGFEGHPDLLDEGARMLPLIGTPASSVRRVRDPAACFGLLASSGIAYPPTRLGALARRWPGDARRWLVKDATGCGGWQVRHATPSAPAELRPHEYLQQEAPGAPMSATFVANGHDAVVLGFNALTVRRIGMRPYVYGGVVGPVTLPEPAAAQAVAAVVTLTRAFGLRGVCGLDFLLDGGRIAVLEVNPRPPASMALHGEGLFAAHVHACVQGELPTPRRSGGRVAGIEVVYARHDLTIDEAAAHRLAAWPGACDLPCAGTRVEAGEPLCSLNARAVDAPAVKSMLHRERERLLDALDA